MNTKRHITDNVLIVTALAALFVMGYVYSPLARVCGKIKDPILYTYAVYGFFIVIWIIVIAAILIPRYNRELIRYLNPRLPKNGIGACVVGLGVGAGLNLVCVLPALLRGDVQLMLDSTGVVPLVVSFVMVMVQSGAEEIAYRLYLYRKVERGYSHLSHGKLTVLLCVASSVAFLIPHVSNNGFSAFGAVEIVLFGVILALVVRYFGSFWGVVGIHTGWNYFQAFLLGLPNSGNASPIHLFTTSVEPVSSFFYDAAFGIEGSAFSILVYIVVIGIFIAVAMRRGMRRGADTKK